MLSETIKQILIDRYDPDAMVEILGLSTEDLIEYFEDIIIEHLDRFAIYPTVNATRRDFIPELWSDQILATYKQNLVVANRAKKGDATD